MHCWSDWNTGSAALKQSPTGRINWGKHWPWPWMFLKYTIREGKCSTWRASWAFYLCRVGRWGGGYFYFLWMPQDLSMLCGSRIQSRLQRCSVSVKETSPTSAKMGKTSLVNRVLGRAYTISNYSMKARLATAQLLTRLLSSHKILFRNYFYFQTMILTSNTHPAGRGLLWQPAPFLLALGAAVLSLPAEWGKGSTSCPIHLH